MFYSEIDKAIDFEDTLNNCNITSREKNIIIMRKDGFTYKEISLKWKICQERVRQLESKIVQYMRRYLIKDSLKLEFF